MYHTAKYQLLIFSNF